MSDIVIPNAKLPTNCFTCDYEKLTKNCPCYIGICSASEYKDSRHADCPLVELPPHGRLGDLGVLYETIDSSVFWDSSDISLIEDIVNDAPTIIEASK